MKTIIIFALLVAPANMHAMMADDSKREIEELKRYIAENGIDAITQEAREYFEEKGVNFSHLATPESHSTSSGDYHRMIVEEFIKRHGKDSVCPAVRNQIVANGWHTQSALMAPFAPEPAPPPAIKEPDFFEAHKAPIILAAVAVGCITYDLLASYQEITEQEWQKAESWEARIKLVASKTCLTKLLNRLR